METENRDGTFFKSCVHLKAPSTPRSTMMDFETVCINSVGYNFSNTEIKDCFFHFSQAIYRKIFELGYAVQYRQEKEFNLAIRLLAALAFASPLHL